MMSKFACVTGADRGLGLGLVMKLLDKGYTVFAGRYLKDWNELERLKTLFEERLYIVDLDNTNETSVRVAREFIESKTDTLDVLINNAAILGDTEKTILDDLDFEEMKQVFNVNTLGPLRVSNALISLILKGEDKLIVNISSEAGSISDCERESWFGYCMSKSALNMQCAVMHNKLKKLGGQVLAIHPGWVKTYMRGKVDEAAALTPEQSAEHIVELIHNHEKYKSEKPAYVDYSGKEMKW
jgi:NAD(P)-dependent dehydrogenase (short-subunit alcohol dehydrogenase family)